MLVISIIVSSFVIFGLFFGAILYKAYHDILSDDMPFELNLSGKDCFCIQDCDK